MTHKKNSCFSERKGLLNDTQERAVQKMVDARGGLVWWKVGEGKTRIGLSVFARLQHIYSWSLPSTCLVICRRRSFYDWRIEINTCFPNCHVYEDTIPIHPPTSLPCFLLVSHAEIEKRQRVLQANQFIRFILLDELWLYANKKSKRSKGVYYLTLGRKAVGLSGTIMKANCLDEVYNQARAVQKHRYLAQSLTKFRTLTTELKPGWQALPIWLRTKQRSNSYAKVMSLLSDCSDINFPKSKRLIHEQYHTVPSTKEQRELFDDLRELYAIEALGLEFKNALSIGIKAQQIANGWVENRKGEMQIVATLKPEKLKDELETIITSGERAVVWCAFRYDVAMLADFLPFASLQMLGGKDFDIDKWNNSNIRVCLATEASGNSVNHFRDTAYAIYFSSNYKWLDMQQSKGRTDRTDSSHTECFYKYLQVEHSMDSHIYQTALASGAAEQRLIASVQNWLKPKTK